MDVVNVICMKWGHKYSTEYVNRLFGMVKRHLSLPFRFICCTDDTRGICPDIEIQPLPKLALPPGVPERGWRKLTVFDKHFGGLSGLALFLDLDIVIVDNIDELFTQSGEFLIAHEVKHGRMQGNSSVFRFEIGKYPEILHFFEKNSEQIRRQVRHEQAYLSMEMEKRGELKFWEDGWVVSFKYHCCPSWLGSWFKSPFLPKDAKIIIFHGVPKPPEAIRGVSGKWYRRFQPATWLQAYWKA